MAYPGLVLANAALGEGVEVHLFFTFWGFDMINKKTMADLKFTLLGNTATHMPQGLGGLPGITAHGDAQDAPVDRRPRRPRDPRVPPADRRLRRSPLGLPDVRGHAAPRGGGPVRRGRGASSAPPTSSRRPRAPSSCSSDALLRFPPRTPGDLRLMVHGPEHAMSAVGRRCMAVPGRVGRSSGVLLTHATLLRGSRIPPGPSSLRSSSPATAAQHGVRRKQAGEDRGDHRCERYLRRRGAGRHRRCRQSPGTPQQSTPGRPRPPSSVAAGSGGPGRGRPWPHRPRSTPLRAVSATWRCSVPVTNGGARTDEITQQKPRRPPPRSRGLRQAIPPAGDRWRGLRRNGARGCNASSLGPVADLGRLLSVPMPEVLGCQLMGPSAFRPLGAPTSVSGRPTS